MAARHNSASDDRHAPPRELGIITEYGRLDSRGKKIGFCKTGSERERLFLEESQVPPSIKTGDLVTFERGVFRSQDGDFGKALRVRLLKDSLHDPAIRDLCAASLEPGLWSLVAVEHIQKLPEDEQISWLLKRSAQRSSIPEAVWDVLTPSALRLNDVWRLAPAGVQDRLRAKALELLDTDFLQANAQFDRQGIPLPPLSECRRLAMITVSEWAIRELATRDIPVPLDQEQAMAVASVRGDIQVVARAGSGKTRTLVTRAVFLQKHCGVAPNEMLLLAFNKKAADEMKVRLREHLGNDLPHVMTFHALAYALVHPGEDLVFDDSSADRIELSREVQKVIKAHVRSPEHGAKITELMLAHFRQDWERIVRGGFELAMDELLEYRRNLARESLKGDRVKSFGERLIANTLFEHDIAYRYEASHRWHGTNYRPDFMIGDHKNGGVIIEYFGMAGDADYDEMSEKKREFWAEQSAKWSFLEYQPEDITRSGEERFVERFTNDLAALGLQPMRLSEEEIWKRIKSRAIFDFTKAMKGFILRCRKRNFTPNELVSRVGNHESGTHAEHLFLEVAKSVYPAYVHRLAETAQEDFDGLLWRAIEEVRAGNTTFVRSQGKEKGNLHALRFAMVDEFQDFSEMFAELLRAIRQQNEQVNFFCVGDDWQAINGFAGAELRFFEDFAKYFRAPSTVHISTNYRSASSIVEAGNALMTGLGQTATPAPDASPGNVVLADIEDFSPTPFEQARHQGDDFTPAVLRLVTQCFERHSSVVLLSRRNGVPWNVNYDEGRHGVRGDLEHLLAHIRGYLPEDVRERVSVSTTHGYKGLEKQAVIVVDAVDRSYPLVHPHWVFLRIFGDTIEKTIAEERRLFYVAATRAENTLILLTEGRRKSSFLDDIESRNVKHLNWRSLKPAPSLLEGQLEIRVHNRNARHTKDQLKNELNFQWNGRYWYKLASASGFEFSDLLTQEWTREPGIRIEVFNETNQRLHRHPS